jgi:hypothetical protein
VQHGEKAAGAETASLTEPGQPQPEEYDERAMEPKEVDAVHEFARYLGIDPTQDAALLWIALEARAAPLPPPWAEHVDDASGRRWFFNPVTQENSWEHPLADVYRQKVAFHRSQGVDVTGWLPAVTPATSSTLEETLRLGRSLGFDLPEGLSGATTPASTATSEPVEQARAPRAPSPTQHEMSQGRVAAVPAGAARQGEWAIGVSAHPARRPLQAAAATTQNHSTVEEAIPPLTSEALMLTAADMEDLALQEQLVEQQPQPQPPSQLPLPPAPSSDIATSGHNQSGTGTDSAVDTHNLTIDDPTTRTRQVVAVRPSMIAAGMDGGSASVASVQQRLLDAPPVNDQSADGGQTQEAGHALAIVDHSEQQVVAVRPASAGTAGVGKLPRTTQQLAVASIGVLESVASMQQPSLDSPPVNAQREDPGQRQETERALVIADHSEQQPTAGVAAMERQVAMLRERVDSLRARAGARRPVVSGATAAEAAGASGGIQELPADAQEAPRQLLPRGGSGASATPPQRVSALRRAAAGPPRAHRLPILSPAGAAAVGGVGQNLVRRCGALVAPDGSVFPLCKRLVVIGR